MTIKLTAPILEAGVEKAAGTQLTLSADREAELVNRGVAVWVGDDPGAGGAVPAMQNEGGTAMIDLATGANRLTFGQTKAAANLEIMPTNDVSMWNTDKTAALTVAVDTTVLFDGRPTLKITIPAGTSGTCKVGTIVANALIPYGWDKKDLALALMHSGFTGYDWSTTFPPAPVMYLGDSGYTHFWTSGASLGTYPEIKPRADEWFVAKPPATWGTGGGTPDTNLMTGGVINQTALRCKLQWTQVSQATDCYIWIGFFGKMPKRRKATLVWCMDDGYAEWDTFLKPLFKHYDQPVSMGISKDLVGRSGYLTAAQIQALYNDQSRLFDIVNHAVDNTGYNTLGAAAYYAHVTTNRDYLRSLGITGDGPLHHPIVQSQWGNDLVDLLSAGGFLTSRSSVMNAAMHGRDQLIRSGQDKLRWILGADAFLGSGTNLAAAKAVVDAADTAGDFYMIGGHEFKDSGGVAAYTWTRSDMEQLVGYVQAKVEAGTHEVKSWSRWYADLTGRNCDRR